jgi:hypothetical protein
VTIALASTRGVQAFAQLGDRFDFGNRGEVATAKAADLALHAALLMSPLLAAQAKEGSKP